MAPGGTPTNKTLVKMQAEVFKALSHPTRLEILYLLEKGPLCVCKIVEALNGEFSNISRHLSKLGRAGILDQERQGTSIYYFLRCPCILDFFKCVDDVIIDREQDQVKKLREI